MVTIRRGDKNAQNVYTNSKDEIRYQFFFKIGNHYYGTEIESRPKAKKNYLILPNNEVRNKLNQTYGTQFTL